MKVDGDCFLTYLHEKHNTDQRQDRPIYLTKYLLLLLRRVRRSDFKRVAFLFNSGLHTEIMRCVLLGGLAHDGGVADPNSMVEAVPI